MYQSLYLIFLFITFLSINFAQNKFKNVQLLNNKSSRELIAYMKSINKDLGVKCTYCHDMNDKSLDNDKKIIARKMIKMQQDINKQYFINTSDSLKNNIVQITCWTCHRGSSQPELARSK